MRIGIDLGGSKIALVVLDDRGEVRWQRREATPRDGYTAIVDAIATLTEAAERAVGETCSVGIGTPGAISPTTARLRNANTTCLNGQPFKTDLEQRLAREVRMANDANCFALSEASDGAARGAAVAFGVILGTGVGGGVVVDGRPLTGINAIGGEWGHNPLPAPRPGELPGPPCYCGRRGCIETWLCGPALEREFAQATGRRLPAGDIAARAAAGDGDADATLVVYEQRLARALASVINILDPEVIVLGGGLSNIERLYRNVPALWSEHVFSDHVATRLVPPEHGDDSGVRGAAWLW